MLTHAEVAVSRKSDKKVEGTCRLARQLSEVTCVPWSVPVLAETHTQDTGAASWEVVPSCPGTRRVTVCAPLSGDTAGHCGMAAAIFHRPLMLAVSSCVDSLFPLCIGSTKLLLAWSSS